MRYLWYNSYMVQTSVAPSSNAMRDRALNYLAAGLSETATASALGVTLPLISSYTADPDFMEIVRVKRAEAVAHSQELQQNYASAQLKLSNKLLTLVQQDYPWTPLELVKVSETLDKMQEKYRPQQQSDTPATQLNIVQLVMPSVLVAKYTTNSSNEIIAVNDQMLRTINSQQLIRELTEEHSNATRTDHSAVLESAAEPEASTNSSAYRFSNLPTAASSRATSKASRANTRLLGIDEL